MKSNNRLEFALARPTRKSEAPLLAAQPERCVLLEKTSLRHMLWA